MAAYHDTSDHVLVELGNSDRLAKVSPEDLTLVSGYRWCVNNAGYVTATIDGQSVFLHRFLLQPSHMMQVDHINRDKLDNRRANLRIATRSQNNANSTGHADRFSKYKGVFRHRDRWCTQITVDGRELWIGSYATEEDAARAYDSAAMFYYKEFAVTNFDVTEALSVDELRHRNWLVNKMNTSSQFRGVYFDRNLNKWCVSIKLDKVSKYIGAYISEVDAAKAYDSAAKCYLGGRGETNFCDAVPQTIEELRRQSRVNNIKARRTSSSRYRGVHYKRSHDKWCAAITVNRKQKYIGIYSSELEAAEAYNRAALRYFRAAAILNKIPDLQFMLTIGIPATLQTHLIGVVHSDEE